MKAGDMSSLIESEDGTSDLCLLLQTDRETEIERENEIGTSYWFTGYSSSIQCTTFHWPSLAFWFPKQQAGI